MLAKDLYYKKIYSIRGARKNAILDFVKKMQDLLNGESGQVLNFRKPFEVFNELINNNVVVVLNSRNIRYE